MKGKASSGVGITWGAEHRDGNGVLITRQVSIEPPSPPTCIKPQCLLRYLYDALLYALVSTWHSRRVVYAEANRHKDILERYRTGEPSPENLWQAIHANLKLTCPLCRRYNADPLLFRTNINKL